MRSNYKRWWYLILILIVLGDHGAIAKVICTKNRANCLDLPLEWDRHEEDEGLAASRYVDDDRLTLNVIESSSDYWQQSIQDFLGPLKKKGGFKEYEVEEITAGDIKYTAYAYEAFGRRFDRRTSRRMDFYIYRKGPVVRIVLFEAAGSTFIKMRYEIEEILGSASFFNPKSIEVKKKDFPEEDDGWGEYGYKPKSGAAGDDNYGWGEDERNNQEKPEDDALVNNGSQTDLTEEAPSDNIDSLESLPFQELEEERLSLERGSGEPGKERDWLRDNSNPFEKSEEATFPFSHASDNEDSFGSGPPDKTDDGW